jgi:hypothetical protein
MKLVIIFIGLVSHITLGSGANEDHFAALVRDSNHRPQLVVPKGGAVVVPNTTPFDTLFSDASNDYYKIANHRIWIQGSSGVTALTADFAALVLHLPAVTNGNQPSSDISGKKFKTGVATTIVDLKGGTLDVDTLWTQHVDAGAVDQDCVARSTSYTLPLGGGTVDIVSDDGRLLRLKAGTTVTVENSVINQNLGEHFEMYQSFLNASTIDTPVADFGTFCRNRNYPQVRPTKGASVECSNSQFP